jgi:protocatechuate 3,4-dioxygenase beta subunit
MTELAGPRLLDRRTALRLLGAAGLGAVVVACGGGGSNNKQSSASGPKKSGTAGSSATSTTGQATSGSTTCVLAPEMTEGPYYLDLDLVRSDVTEGLAGAPLALTLTVADASTCTPIEGAAVDLWHASPAGDYSGVSGNSGTFLRGTQVSGSDGAVRFATLYPGWYAGRAVHMHLKVHVGGNEVHTGQLFFPDAFTAKVYERDPYASRGQPDVLNAQDQIFSNGGSQSLLSPTSSGDGYAAGITLGVMKS